MAGGSDPAVAVVSRVLPGDVLGHQLAGEEAHMIVLECVSKSYDGGSGYSVRDVNLHVPAGRLLVLLGGSGCGKTTTLKMINRLIEPSAGRILVNGRDVRDWIR